MNTSKGKVIETLYRGFRFRSRLEARWAVFFDYLCIPFEYEKEGFDLPSGKYLPDFWLPEQQYWIEIKGQEATQKELDLCIELEDYTKHKAFVFDRGITNGKLDSTKTITIPEAQHYNDVSYMWCKCPDCGSLGIEFEGRSDRLPCKISYEDAVDNIKVEDRCPRHSANLDKGYTEDDKQLILAYVKAKSARFEHGAI